MSEKEQIDEKVNQGVDKRTLVHDQVKNNVSTLVFPIKSMPLLA